MDKYQSQLNSIIYLINECYKNHVKKQVSKAAALGRAQGTWAAEKQAHPGSEAEGRGAGDYIPPLLHHGARVSPRSPITSQYKTAFKGSNPKAKALPEMRWV